MPVLDEEAVKDDDRAVTVTSPTVDEASPYAVFTVTGGNKQQTTLSLAGQNGDGANLADLQYFDGSKWVDYTAGAVVSLDASGSLLVRVALSPEQEAAVDGPETFTLVATNTGKTVSTGGLGTIVDDGTGDYFAADNQTATPALPAGVVLDDDRVLAVSDVTVNEGSPYAVFTVTGGNKQQTTLSLDNQNGDGADLVALQYFDPSANAGAGAWVDYTAGAVVSLDASGSLLVRVAISPEQEAAVDGPETFTLVATNTGKTVSTGGLGTIVDDGTGDYFAADNQTATPALPAGVVLDDDRPITVSGGVYNEASPRAVFSVNANPNQLITLDVRDAAEVGKTPTGDDEGKPDDSLDTAPIYYSVDGGTTWALYSGAFQAGSVPVLVAVDISNEHDSVFEGEEQLQLVVSSSERDYAGFASIVDDGTGAITAAIDESSTNIASPAADLGGLKDDDRAITVTGGTYNEASPRAVFTVNANPGQLITLDVRDAAEAGKAPTGDNEGNDAINGDSLNNAPIYYSINGGADWVLYDGKAFNAGSVPVLVAVDIGNERDSVFEGEEQLQLVVSSSGRDYAGFASIVDDGTGDLVAVDQDGNPRIDGAGQPVLDMSVKDDDRPKPAPIIAQATVIVPPAPIQLPPEQPQPEPLPPLAPLPSPEVPQNSLMVFSGITDQFVETGRQTSFALPADAFVHTQPDALLTLTAKQADGSDLPEWIQFDPQSQTFLVNPPPGFTGEIRIMVIARDSEGREATAPFRFFVGNKQDQSAADTKPTVGRASLSEKLQAAKRSQAVGAGLDRMLASKSIAELPAVKERKVTVQREVASI